MTALEIVTLVTAIIGAVAGISALAVQFADYLNAGSRVVVDWGFGFPVFGPRVGDQCIIVNAYNRGRGSVQLASVGFTVEVGGKLTDPTLVPNFLPGSTLLPHTLAGEHPAMFVMDLAGMRETLATNGYKSARAFVSLGTGKRKYAKESTTLAKLSG